MATETGYVDLAGDTGAFKALFRPWAHTWSGFRDGDHYERDIERDPGVYVPSHVAGDGTAVQNDDEVLRELVTYAARVAGRAAEDGFEIYGVGSDHSAKVYLYALGSGGEDGRRFLVGTPFTACSVSGLSLKWWDAYPESPTLDWLPDAVEEIVGEDPAVVSP